MEPETAIGANALEEIIKCCICYGRIQSAELCPHCSKVFCSGCITRWITAQHPQCPHCREGLQLHQLVKCRFVDELCDEVSKAAPATPAANACEEHNNLPLHYLCLDCTVAVCSDCALFGGHRGHDIAQIQQIYDEKLKLVTDKTPLLESRLGWLSGIAQGINDNIDTIAKAKEDRCAEIRRSSEAMLSRVEAGHKEQLVAVLSTREDVMAELQRLQDGLQHVLSCVHSTPKDRFVASTADELQQQLNMLLAPSEDEEQEQSWGATAEPVDAQHGWAGGPSELVPPYEFGEFAIQGFSAKRDSGDVLYSDCMHSSSGVSWRLKVYPNGNGVAHGVYLSVFLEMVKSVHQQGGPSKYEYRIEMGGTAAATHGAPLLVAREFASEYEEGECWGYNRFARVEHLVHDGYIDASDTLTLRYAVRRSSFPQLCADQAQFITSLQHKNAALVSALCAAQGSTEVVEHVPRSCAEHSNDREAEHSCEGKPGEGNMSMEVPATEGRGRTQHPPVGEQSMEEAALASLRELSLTLDSTDQNIPHEQLLRILEAATNTEREIVQSTSLGLRPPNRE